LQLWLTTGTTKLKGAGGNTPLYYMPYSQKTIDLVAHSPKNLGNRLGRWAIYRDFSVVRIAQVTGASRQSVYNWFEGGEVFVAYKPIVEALIRILQAHESADEAYSKACEAFKIAA